MKLILACLLLIGTHQAQADQLSLLGGFNSTEFDSDGGWDRKFGWEFGASYVRPLQDKVSLRTGASVVKKASEFSPSNTKVEFLFLELPATLMYSFNNNFSAFSGLNFDITLADDGAKSESFAVNIPFGARFSWAKPHSLEMIFEFGITDIAEGDVKIGNSLSVRYLYDFSVSFK